MTIANPTLSTHAVSLAHLNNNHHTKTYVDGALTVPTSRVTVDSSLDFGTFLPRSSTAASQLTDLCNKTYVDGAIAAASGSAKPTYSIILSATSTVGLYPNHAILATGDNPYVYWTSVPSAWKSPTANGNGWFYFKRNGYEYYLMFRYDSSVFNPSQWRITAQVLGSPKIYDVDVDMATATNLGLIDASNNYSTGVFFNRNPNTLIRSLYISVGQWGTPNDEAMLEVIFTQR